MDVLIKTFMSQKSYAIAGSFRNDTKFAYQILQKLINKGCTVYPVTPSIKEVEGIKCYKSLLDIPNKIDAVSLVTPPAVTENIVKQCLEKGIKHVWMQPGAESEAAIEYCKNNKINVIYNTCLLIC